MSWLHSTVKSSYKDSDLNLPFFPPNVPRGLQENKLTARKLRDCATFTLSSKYTTVFNQ